MNVKQLVERKLEKEAKGVGWNVSQCNFVHHKSRMTWPGIEPGSSDEKPATNLVSYGTAHDHLTKMRFIKKKS
jgi:hypothetical protein